MSGQLNPINILICHLVPSSQDVNAPNIPAHSDASFRARQSPAQVAELQLGQQEQSRTRNNVAVNVTAQIDEELPKSSLIIARSPTTEPERLLWQARISAPKEEKNSRSQNELQHVIKQIGSVEFRPQDETPEPSIVVEPVQKTEPDKISVDIEAAQDKSEAELPYERVTDKTLHLFKSLSQHPDQLHNPFELAEVLFCSGNLKEAAMCYQHTLDDRSIGDANSTQNKAWILFQIGNCLRNDDPPTAMQMYRQLIAEYPDSPWADLARAQSKLVSWYQQEKPRALIDEN